MTCLTILFLTMSIPCQVPQAALANQRGIKKAEVQDFQGAAAEFRSAHHLDPDCPVIEVNLVIACLNAGILDEARARLRRLEAVLPGDPYVLYLAGVTDVRSGKESEARVHFSRLLANDGADSAALSQLGLIEFHAGNHARARELFEAALQVDPEDTVALYNQARLCFLGGDREEGNRLADQFKAARQRRPDRPIGGMGEPVIVPGKYARLRQIGDPSGKHEGK